MWASSALQTKKSGTFIILIWSTILKLDPSKSSNEIPKLMTDFFNFNTSLLTIDTNIYIIFRFEQLSRPKILMNELWEFYTIKTIPFSRRVVQTKDAIDLDLLNMRTPTRRHDFNLIPIVGVSLCDVR